MLIAAGHGSKNLYQILQLLYDQPGTGIPADFVASVGNNPGGSEVFTAVLSYFAGLNGPVCINADGTLGINSIFGREYDGEAGFVTNKVHYPGIALANYTMAELSTSYIYAGARIGTPFPNYLAIGIAWADTAGPESIPTLNEWGMILMGLILAGIASVSMRRRQAVGHRLS